MRPVEAAVNNNPRHRGDIDNRPAAGLQHQFRFRFAGVPYASEIDIDHPLPLLALHLQRRIGVGDPGGVNGDIEAAIAAFGQRDGGAQVGNLADIAVIRASLTADGFNMADRFRQPAVVAKIKTDYPCTRAGEAAGDGLSMPLPAPVTKATRSRRLNRCCAKSLPIIMFILFNIVSNVGSTASRMVVRRALSGLPFGGVT